MIERCGDCIAEQMFSLGFGAISMALWNHRTSHRESADDRANPERIT
ncbi:hypothetical protein ABH897_003066 [Paenibacillus sp. RC73]